MDFLEKSNQEDVVAKLEKGAKKLVGDVPGADIAINFVISKVLEKYDDVKCDRTAFQKELEGMSDEALSVFIPDVYVKSIYKIDYKKLWDAGIRLLSFDIDDTIDDSVKNKTIGVNLPKDAKILFAQLKEMGFIVTLMTNASVKIAETASAQLQAHSYISKANKPETISFERMLERYEKDKTQMAHIGNSMRADIAGGNLAGVTTCLVRRNGFGTLCGKMAMKLIGLRTRGHLLREELLRRNMWHKHHIEQEKDQYYQLGDIQKYSPNFRLYKG